MRQAGAPAVLVYLRNGHEDERGRWGNAHLRKAASSGTTATYFTVLRTFFRYLVAEQAIHSSPLETMPHPVDRPDQVTPFSPDQIRAIRAAASRSRHAKRDEAIVLPLLDTGMRASERCGLLTTDLDLQERRCSVLGKSNKRRLVFFGRETARAIHQYGKVTERCRSGQGPLFLADRGGRSGDGLTRSGLLQLVDRLGKAAKIEGCAALRTCSAIRLLSSFSARAATCLRSRSSSVTRR